MRSDRLALALTLAATGCSSVCKGPSCVGSYSAERVLLMDWSADLADTLGPTDASARYDGTASDGADWFSIPGPPGTLFIGMPDADRVVRVPIREDTGGIEPELELTGSGAFGASVLSMDVDGSGVRDLLISAPEYDFAAGAVFVFHDAGGGLVGKLSAGEADVVLTGARASDRLGTTITPCADLTGDGIPEFAISAPWVATPPGATEDIPALAGGVFLVQSELLAAATGPTSIWDVSRVWWGDASGDALGRSFSCRADLTGDRRADIAVGAPFAEGDGLVYVIPIDAAAADLGLDALPASGPISTASPALLRPGTSGAWFGSSMIAAEFDGSAPLDLVIGSPGAHSGSGRVEIFRGIELLTDPAPWRVIRNSSTRDEPDHLGRTLAEGDLDGDSRDDLIVGAPDWYGGGNDYDSGSVFVWSGVAVELITTFTISSAEWTVTGTAPFQQVGRQIRVIPQGPDLPGTLVMPTRTTPPTDE